MFAKVPGIMIGVGQILFMVGILGNVLIVWIVAGFYYGFGLSRAVAILDPILNHYPKPAALLGLAGLAGLAGVFLAVLGFFLQPLTEKVTRITPPVAGGVLRGR